MHSHESIITVIATECQVTLENNSTVKQFCDRFRGSKNWSQGRFSKRPVSAVGLARRGLAQTAMTFY
jgi:hypothetical protein